MQNKPPRVEEDSMATWLFEATDNLNLQEDKLNNLLDAIKKASSFSDLQDRVKELR